MMSVECEDYVGCDGDSGYLITAVLLNFSIALMNGCPVSL